MYLSLSYTSILYSSFSRTFVLCVSALFRTSFCLSNSLVPLFLCLSLAPLSVSFLLELYVSLSLAPLFSFYLLSSTIVLHWKLVFYTLIPQDPTGLSPESRFHKNHDRFWRSSRPERRANETGDCGQLHLCRLLSSIRLVLQSQNTGRSSPPFEGCIHTLQTFAHIKYGRPPPNVNLLGGKF